MQLKKFKKINLTLLMLFLFGTTSSYSEINSKSWSEQCNQDKSACIIAIKNEIRAIVFKSITALKKPSNAIENINKIWKIINHPRRRPIKILYRSNMGAHKNFQVKGN